MFRVLEYASRSNHEHISASVPLAFSNLTDFSGTRKQEAAAVWRLSSRLTCGYPVGSGPGKSIAGRWSENARFYKLEITVTQRQPEEAAMAIGNGLAAAGIPRLVEMLQDGGQDAIWNLSEALNEDLRRIDTT